jgi:hypothetical protein
VQFPSQLLTFLKLGLLDQLSAGDGPVADGRPEGSGEQHHGDPGGGLGEPGEVDADDGGQPHRHDRCPDRHLPAGTPPQERVDQHEHGPSAVQNHRFGAHGEGGHVEDREAAEGEHHRGQRMDPAYQDGERQATSECDGCGSPGQVPEGRFNHEYGQHQRSESPVAPGVRRWAPPGGPQRRRSVRHDCHSIDPACAANPSRDQPRPWPMSQGSVGHRTRAPGRRCGRD